MKEQRMGKVMINGHPYLRPVVRVASVSFDGSACIVPIQELMAVIEDGQDYTVRVYDMSAKQFENLPEFSGW